MPEPILIIDDNAEDRELIARLLKRSGDKFAPVYEAASAIDGLRLLSEPLEISCVLLDYSLPGRDGLSALGSILEAHQDMPVIMVTGRGDEEIAVGAMQGGAQDYIPKHVITLPALQRSISRAIERSCMTKLIRIQRESLEAFAHVLVHDLRAPLRSVKGAIEMLMEDLPPEIVSEHKELLAFVENGAKGMDQLIKALQVYNSVAGAKPQFEPTNLHDVLTAAQRNLKADTEASKATIHLASPLPSVDGHEPLIIQLFQNILGNGIKYNRSDSPHISVSAQESADSWDIRVSDNGIGIAPSKAASIFEPFNRAHKDEEFEGTGLGLATCKRIMELHSGTIRHEANEPCGSVFVCQFKKPPAETKGS